MNLVVGVVVSEAGRRVGLVQPVSGAWPVRPGPQGQEDKR